jgi:hypothetical protein
MSSRNASLIGLIQAHFTTALKGVSPVPLPSDALFPYVTIQEGLGKELESLTGASGLIKVPHQFNIWGKDYEEAWGFRKSIRDYIQPYRGAAGSNVIVSANHYGDRELYDGPKSVHQLIWMVNIWWEI